MEKEKKKTEIYYTRLHPVRVLHQNLLQGKKTATSKSNGECGFISRKRFCIGNENLKDTRVDKQ